MKCRTVKRVVQSVSSGSLELVNLQVKDYSSAPCSQVAFTLRRDTLEEIDLGVGRDVGRVKDELLELSRVDVAGNGCEEGGGLVKSVQGSARGACSYQRGSPVETITYS